LEVIAKIIRSKIRRTSLTMLKINLYWLRIDTWPGRSRWKCKWYWVNVLFFTIFLFCSGRMFYAAVDQPNKVSGVYWWGFFAVAAELVWLIAADRARKQREKLIMVLIARKTGKTILDFAAAKNAYIQYLFRVQRQHYFLLAKEIDSHAAVFFSKSEPSIWRLVLGPDSKPRVNAFFICFLAVIVATLSRNEGAADAIFELWEHLRLIGIGFFLIATFGFGVLVAIDEFKKGWRSFLARVGAMTSGLRYSGVYTRELLKRDLATFDRTRINVGE
jgi:hypothetical protein